MTGPVLAPGLVWCKDCQMRTALAAAGGKCPVCDPDQVSDVSARAQDELDRIDAVLAGSDTSPYDAARWAADGSHQDEEHGEVTVTFYHAPNPFILAHETLMRELEDYDPRAARRRRLEDDARQALGERPVAVPPSGDPVHDSFVESFVNRRVVRSGGRRAGRWQEMREAVLASMGESPPWLSVGYMEHAALSFGGSRDDESFTLGPGRMWVLPHLVSIDFAPDGFQRETLGLFFGGPIPEELTPELCRWEDDGGPVNDTP